LKYVVILPPKEVSINTYKKKKCLPVVLYGT
jgi:hypothetical protein